MRIRGHALIQGASRGIGLEFVRQLAALPDIESITATCRRDSPELRSLADGDRVHVEQVDVTDEATIARAAGRVAERTEALHLLVNAAGLLHEGDQGPERRLEDVTPEHLQRAFAVNAIGPLLVAKHFAPRFRHGEPAVLANLSARVGSIGDNRKGGWYAYRASKAAQNQFTRTMGIELRRMNPKIVVVALHPGTVDTELSRPFQRNVPPEKLFSVERAVRQLLRVIEGLQPEDHGGFFAWDGQPIAW